MVLVVVDEEGMTKEEKMTRETGRRGFLQAAIAAGVFPSIVPSTVFGAEAPSNKLQIALIGCGRIGTTMDIGGLANNQDLAMLTTICDVDAVRLENMKRIAEERCYKRKLDHLKLEMDYRKVLDDPGIDGVMICTQDHWHARMVVEACLKGKDVYVQKPMALSIEESESIAEAVRKMKRVFHIGTQQRGYKQFRDGVEYVMSGRIGKLKHIDVGLITNSPDREWSVPAFEEAPDPRDFNFDLWLGPARNDVRYSQLRTHWRPVGPDGKGYARIPGQNVGWLQIQDYCTGNIGGWGSHHIDIAQWAMGCVGPVSVKCEEATFMKGRLFNVHHDHLITYRYGNGVELKCASARFSELPKGMVSRGGYGVRFVGENGDWIWTSRSSADIPEGVRVDTARAPKADVWRPLEASRKAIIEGEPEKQAVRNTHRDHHRPWFIGMRERKDTHIPVEEANTSTISCILGYHAMNNIGHEIKWDPVKRAFVNPEDQKLYSCFERPEFSVAAIMKEIRKRG